MEHYYKHANKATALNKVFMGNQPCEDADHILQRLGLFPTCVPDEVGINKKLYSHSKMGTMSTASHLGVKQPGLSINHAPPSSVKVKERV
jgi:hypothetical protein